MKGLFTAIAVMAALCLGANQARAQLELKNDGFVNGQAAGFQGGFVATEIGASRFIAPSAGRTLQSVVLLFGGASSTQTITLHVWDDSAGATTPGAELFQGDFQLTGSNDNLSSLDLTGMNVVVPMQFRVGIEFQHAGLPSIARDDDGSISAGRNFILAQGIGWVTSQTLGLTGDWILRAIVSDAGGSPDAGPGGPDAGPGGPDAGPGSPDAGPGAPDGGTTGCNGNSECPVGQFCDTQLHTCTFECRTSDDCGGGTCNSLGQCLAAEGDSGGCCSTGATTTGGMLGALGLAGAVGLLVTRRRRKA
ncbi:MAG: hypothetical protein IPL61_31330 [Myxococcales bacterium]|nr:hypothetical protein [Myxococcales bacterium]